MVSVVRVNASIPEVTYTENSTVPPASHDRLALRRRRIGGHQQDLRLTRSVLRPSLEVARRMAC